MALSYDDWKKQWEGMDYQTQQRTANMMKDNATFKEYGQRYVNESGLNNKGTNTQGSNNNSGNFNNSNGTNGQNQQKDYWSDENITDNSEEAKAARRRSMEAVTGYKPYEGNDQNGEELDTSKFGQSTGQINVKEGTAAQTGQPDYQLNSEARQQEIVNNLNTYWEKNREFFKDRNTFNQIFHYDERDASQKQLLDSYWKKKQDTEVSNKYGNVDALYNGMNNAELTNDQLDIIKYDNPDLYKQWQAKQEEETNLRIANLTTPWDVTSVTELFNTLMEKLNLEPGDPYKIYDNWYDMAERLGVFSDSARLSKYQDQLDANHSKMENIMSRYASSAGGTQSDALVAARLSKALAPYQQIETDLQNSYTALLNGRNSNLAVANQSAQALAMQAAEDQRIFNQRLAGLGFAMSTASYRTPEQQAQLNLQVQSISNDMSLLQQSKQNDLALYNKRQQNQLELQHMYDTAEMQNAINLDMTDLTVENEGQLRTNLNNILSQYYDQYGMMIKRSQQQALNDILQYAKDNNVSVAEALSKNFIEPLQGKAQYQAAVNKTTGYDPYANQQQWQYVQNEDGTVSLKVSGYGEIPASAFKTRSDRIDAYKDVYDYTGGNTVDYVQCLADSIQNGMYGGQCGAFANDVLKASGEGKIFGDSLKQKIDVCNVTKEEGPQPGYAAVFDFGHKSSDGINHGHVAIVTDVHPDGSIDVIESNYNGDGTIRKNTYSAQTVKSSIEGYYKPSNYSTELKPWENSVTTQDGTIVHTQWGDYDDRYSDDFSKILTDSEGKTYTDNDKKTLIKQLGGEENYFNQLYSFKKNRESKGSQQALDALKTIQKFENAGGRNYWGNLIAAGNTENKRIFNQLQKQLQLDQLFKAKENGASFGSMSDSEWDILGDASNSLNWNSLGGFNAELEDIKQSLWSAAFGNDNYTKENRQAYKDAHPLASQADKSNNNNGGLQTPFQNSTLFGQNRGYNMNFTSNKN